MGESDARSCKTSVYDGIACGFCGGFGFVHKEDFPKRLDGIPRSSARTGIGTCFLPAPRYDFPIGCAVHASDDLGTNSDGLYGHGFASGRRSVYHHGSEKAVR